MPIVDSERNTGPRGIKGIRGHAAAEVHIMHVKALWAGQHSFFEFLVASQVHDVLIPGCCCSGFCVTSASYSFPFHRPQYTSTGGSVKNKVAAQMQLATVAAALDSPEA